MAGTGPRVVVAGAGVLGLMCALRLAQHGGRVALYEAAPYRPNASIVAAGMIAPATECVLEPALREVAVALRTSRAVWTQVAAELGVRLDPTGAIHTGPAYELQAREALLRSLGFLVSRMAQAGDPADLPLFTAEDAALSTGRAMPALRRAAVAAGVDIRVGRVERGADGPTVAGDPVAADALVLAMGAQGRASGLAPELGRLSPIKGQLLRWGNPHADRGPVLRTPRLYLATVEDAILAGATMEPGRDDLEAEPALLSPIRAEAEVMAPALKALEPPTIDVGVRADTPDGLPMVGPSAAPGVFLATGARRNGWLWAPPVASIIAAQVMGLPLGELAPLAERLHPGRFDRGGAT